MDRPRELHLFPHLIIQVRVNLRRRFVQDDHVAASQYSTGHRDQLALSSAERAGLADGHVEGDFVGALRALQGAPQDRSEMAPFEDVPALLVGVLIERV